MNEQRKRKIDQLQVAAQLEMPGFQLPDHSRYFIGREALLEKMSAHFAESEGRIPYSPYVISGLSGIGKTEVALKYGWLQQAEYAGCIFLSGEQLREGFINLAKQYVIPLPDQKLDTNVIYEQLKKRVSDKPFLIVIDNAVDYAEVSKFLPRQNHGYSHQHFHIVITSNDSENNWGPCAHEKLDPDLPMFKTDALAYVMRGLSVDKDVAKQLCVALHHFPLALSQAVAYLRQNQNTAVAQYLQELKTVTSRKALLMTPCRESKADVRKQAVLTTWLVSLEALQASSPGAGRLLQYLATLSPDEIELTLLNQLPGYDADFLSLFERYSFVHYLREQNQGAAIKVHRLLQEVVIEAVPMAGRTSLIQDVVNILFANLTYQRQQLAPVVNAERHWATMRRNLTGIDALPITGQYLRGLYALSLYLSDHLKLYPDALTYLDFVDAQLSAHESIDQAFWLRVKRQRFKLSIRSGNVRDARQKYAALYEPMQAQPILLAKLQLDYVFFLIDGIDFKDLDSNHSVADTVESLLAEASACGEPQVISRASRYHMLILKRKISYDAATLARKKERLNSLEKWQTKIKASIEEECDDLMTAIADRADEFVKYCKLAFDIQVERVGDEVEVLRTLKGLFSLPDVSRASQTAHILMVRFVKQFYLDVLPRLQSAQYYHAERAELIQTVAAFFMSKHPLFVADGSNGLVKSALLTESNVLKVLGQQDAATVVSKTLTGKKQTGITQFYKRAKKTNPLPIAASDSLAVNYKNGMDIPFPEAELRGVVNTVRTTYDVKAGKNLSAHGIGIYYRSAADNAYHHHFLPITNNQPLVACDPSQDNLAVARVSAGFNIAKQENSQSQKLANLSFAASSQVAKDTPDARYHRHSEQQFFNLLDGLSMDTFISDFLKRAPNFVPRSKVLLVTFDIFSERTSCVNCKLSELSVQNGQGENSFMKRLTDYLIDHRFTLPICRRNLATRLFATTRILSSSQHYSHTHENPKNHDIHSIAKQLPNLSIFEVVKAQPTVTGSGSKANLATKPF